MSTNKYELVNLDTGKKSTLQAMSGTVGPDCLGIAPLAKDHGIFTFDPGFMATASCESKITYIDGDAGVLLYRGYPIDQLATKSSFLEVSYLLHQRRTAGRQAARAVRPLDPLPHDDQ